MPVMSHQVYNVPGISLDLRTEETVHQIVDSLSYLDQVANDVFTRIHNKVSENQTRLQKINDRVNLTQAKVDKIKGSNKATKVFASAKYPAPELTEVYPTAFKHDMGLHSPKRPNYRVTAKHRVVDDELMREKLQYINVRGNYLTFTALWANTADGRLMIFFLFFPENRDLIFHANCLHWRQFA